MPLGNSALGEQALGEITTPTAIIAPPPPIVGGKTIYTFYKRSVQGDRR
jgi:hypothetical protein